jgi:hypothetical protein
VFFCGFLQQENPFGEFFLKVGKSSKFKLLNNFRAKNYSSQDFFLGCKNDIPLLECHMCKKSQEQQITKKMQKNTFLSKRRGCRFF